MTEIKLSKLKVTSAFFLIVVYVLILYYPSLFDIPRSDHLVHLYANASEGDLFSLTIKNYNLNRTIPLIKKDFILFRPFLYFFLGLEQFLFGYNFILWQIAGLILHIAVLWQLLKTLLAINNSRFALFTTFFFASMITSIEMISWHHIHGYMLFLLCSIICLREIFYINKEVSIKKKRFWKLFSVFSISCFLHEFAIIHGTLMILFLMLTKTQKQADNSDNIDKKTAALLILVPIIAYLAISLTDLYFLGWPAKNLKMEFNIKSLFINIYDSFCSMFFWLRSGIFPNSISVRFNQRTVLLPALLSSILKKPSMLILSIPGIFTIILFLSKLLRQSSLCQIKKNKRFIILIFLLIFANTFVLVLGKMRIRNLITILCDNSYYGYMFWIYLHIAAYCLIDHKEKPINNIQRRSNMLFLYFATILILFNTILVTTINIKRKKQLTPLRLMTVEANKLIKQHGNESDFSFGVEEQNKNNIYFSWIHLHEEDVPRSQTFLGLLYPNYYTKKNPKYTYIPDSKTSKWKKNY